LALVILCIGFYLLYKRFKLRPGSMAKNANLLSIDECDERLTSESHRILIPPPNMRPVVPLARKFAPRHRRVPLDDGGGSDGRASPLAASPPPATPRERLEHSPEVAEQSGSGLGLPNAPGDNPPQQPVVDYGEGYSVVPSDWTAPPAYSS
ncbi:hypothetical protein EIP91_010802, partial [Steccherinum ochraceum]